MGFGQLGQDKRMHVEAEIMLWGPGNKESLIVELRI